MFSSAKYWDSQLRAGHRLAAVGGSDNHNATITPGEVGAIGWPTTAIEADELSVAAMLKGIRTGRTFIDLTASRDKMLDFEADAQGSSAKMGGTLRILGGAVVSLRIHTVAAEGSVVHLLLDGEDTNTPLPLDGVDSTSKTTFTPGAGRHYLRVEVRDDAGASELISSPLYINFPEE